MADVSSRHAHNSRNNRDRGKERYKDRKQDSPRKKYDTENVRNSKDSIFNDSKYYSYERKLDDRNAHFPRRSEDRRVTYRSNEKNRSTSPPSFSKVEILNADDRFCNRKSVSTRQHRSSHDADRYSDRRSSVERFVVHNNHKSDVSHDDLVSRLTQKVDYLTNKVEYLSQENEKLKYDFRNVNNHARGNSNTDVNIIFQNQILKEKFLPTLEELVSELISENISLEALQTFLFSKRNSLDNDLPEGDLFALDSSTTEPNESSHVPRYETSFSEILQDQDLMNEVKSKKENMRNRMSCFNCSEEHIISECPYQIDHRKVAIARKQRSRSYVPQVRYHVQGLKECDFKPGVISDALREALDLEPHQIPLYMYRMRLLNYPPGWLAEAEVASSGITLYGTDGPVQTEENGKDGNSNNVEVKVQYDPDKLIDFPGFNVPLPPDLVDESYDLGLPPIQNHHLRSYVEQVMPKVDKDILPKRKRKLSLPGSHSAKSQRMEVDMEVDEILDDGSLEFNPPLPEENPPPPPPDDVPEPPFDDIPEPPLDDIPEPPLDDNQRNHSSIESDDESGTNTPMSDSIMEALAPVVERFKLGNSSLAESTSSPSLKDLEAIKKQLEMELEVSGECSSDGSNTNPCSLVDNGEAFISPDNSNDVSSVSECSLSSEAKQSLRQLSRTESAGSSSEVQQTSSQLSRTESQCSGSKLVSLGTPSLSRHSSFQKLPDYDNFSKNVTTHLNFENLPNSTGTYEKMKKVLKKVKEKINLFMQ